MSQDPPRERRKTDRRVGGRAEAGRDLVPVTLAEAVDSASASPAADPAQPDPAFAAQVMGQPGQKRGLKGGQPVLTAARVAYLETEHSGPHDRRPPVGRKTRTEI